MPPEEPTFGQNHLTQGLFFNKVLNKYYIGSNLYDITKRIPSWCDRILYKKYSETCPLSYNKCLLTISDHQPLYGLYRVKTEIIDEEKRQNILDKLIKEKIKKLKDKILIITLITMVIKALIQMILWITIFLAQSSIIKI